VHALAELPLCVAWLDCPPFAFEGDTQTLTGASMHACVYMCALTAFTGNYIAVGTFDPAIEIWNLDVLDPLEPSCVLGGFQRKPKGRKGKDKRLVSGSHQEAVMSLSWNRLHRNLLLSGSGDCTVKLWDVCRHECSHTFEHHTGKVSCVAWHPTEVKLQAYVCTYYYSLRKNWHTDTRHIFHSSQNRYLICESVKAA
jgi:periodic tryptophan protein 1